MRLGPVYRLAKRYFESLDVVMYCLANCQRRDIADVSQRAHLVRCALLQQVGIVEQVQNQRQRGLLGYASADLHQICRELGEDKCCHAAAEERGDLFHRRILLFSRVF